MHTYNILEIGREKNHKNNFPWEHYIMHGKMN